jgi:hypothetical protein
MILTSYLRTSSLKGALVLKPLLALASLRKRFLVSIILKPTQVPIAKVNPHLQINQKL